jgi:hypothetical protein
VLSSSTVKPVAGPLHVRGPATAFGAALVLAFALSITACSSSDVKAESGDPAGADWALPANPAVGVRDTIDGLYAGESTLDAAGETLIQRCMARQGFTYYKLPTGLRDANPMLSPPIYGHSVEEATRFGYRIQQGITDGTKKQPDPTAGLSAAQKKKWGVAFFGPDDGPQVKVKTAGGGSMGQPTLGCLAESRTELFGSVQRETDRTAAATAITQTPQERAAADPAMTDLNKGWSACMKDKGHPGLASPEKAQGQAGDLYTTLSKPDAFRQEVVLAVADAECEASTGYALKRRTLEDRYFTASLRVFEPQLTALHEIVQAALVRARAVLNR